MKTKVKRLAARSADEADRYVQKLRRRGRSAWAEQDGPDHYLCLRMQIVTVAVPADLRQNFRSN